MRMRDLPPLMHALPLTLGIGLTIAWRQVWASERQPLAALIGLPLGMVIGYIILVLAAAAVKDKKQ